MVPKGRCGSGLDLLAGYCARTSCPRISPPLFSAVCRFMYVLPASRSEICASVSVAEPFIGLGNGGLPSGTRTPAFTPAAAGTTVAEVVRTARPPIFYRQEDGFKRQLVLWNEAGLRAQLGRIAQAELHMKLTGLPAETVCREAMLAVAQAARSRAMREGPRARV